MSDMTSILWHKGASQLQRDHPMCQALVEVGDRIPMVLSEWSAASGSVRTNTIRLWEVKSGSAIKHKDLCKLLEYVLPDKFQHQLI